MGVTWIALSDSGVAMLARDEADLRQLQTWKGWFYVAVTSLLLFAIIRRHAGRAMAYEERLRSVVEMVPDIFYEASLDGLSRSFVTPAAGRLFASATGKPGPSPAWMDQLHEADRDRVLRSMRLQLRQEGRFTVDYRIWDEDGVGLRWFKDRGFIGSDHRRGEGFVAGLMEDVTELRQAEAQAEYLAHHDPLTRLINPKGLHLLVESHLKLARRSETSVTCLCLGIDSFDRINSFYGRPAGDEVLLCVAQMLRSHLRDSDIPSSSTGVDDMLARSGDHFLIVLPDTDPSGAIAVAERLASAARALHFRFGADDVRIDVKIGLSAFPDHAKEPGALVAQAELALVRAREERSHGIYVVQLDEQRAETEVLRSLHVLRNALDEDRLAVVFQPILHLKTGRVHRYEALARLRGPDGDLIRPARFIETAERFGLIDRVDQGVFEVVLARLEELRLRGSKTELCVNLSSLHLGSGEFLRWIDRRLGDRGGSLQGIVFEITETAALSDLIAARCFMETARARGARFALDDFGIGFTSFAHLRSLPIDCIKIDGSFIRNLESSRTDRELVKSIDGVAKAFGKTVVAEFVESEAILRILREIGVDYAQGYFVGRPREMEGSELL
jgi:diguanylate cyclase (GGDEF)-like protein